MSGENEEVVKAKDGEQDKFEDVPPVSRDFIDAEFSETRDEKPLRMSIVDDDDTSPIVAEFVEEAPRIAPADVQSVPADDDRFAAFLANLPKDNDVTFIVKRKPDYGLKFRIPYPSGTPKMVRNIYWDGRPAEEIYAILIEEEGGGRYNLQAQYGGQMRQSWDVVLDDPAGPSLREKTLLGEKTKTTEHERVPDASQPPPAPPTPAPSGKEMLESFKAEMFGWREFFKELQPEAPAVVQESQMSVKDQIALEMMKATAQDPELGSMVVKKFLGVADPKGEKSWSDVTWHAISHAGELVQVATTVLNLAAPLLGMMRPSPPNTAMQPVPKGPVINLPPTQPANQPVAGIVMPPAASPGPEAGNEASEAPKAAPAATVAIPRVKW